jgi:broad specificity phosphatase PhoE
MTGLRLVLARHAQTDANLSLLLDSLPPGPPLNELGRQQADELADALAVEPVAAVYASVAVRAQQTARPVAQRHGLTVEIAAGLHEVFMGDLEGTTGEESLLAFITVAKAWSAGELERAIPGGESALDAIGRFTDAIDGIRARHSHGVVVVVTHGAVLQVGVPALASNVATLGERPLVPNTGRIVLDQDDTTPTGWRCVSWTGVRLE